VGRARRRIDVLIILASLNSSLELTQYWEQYETNSLGFEVPGREAATTFKVRLAILLFLIFVY
jgi:hypothetical protein